MTGFAVSGFGISPAGRRETGTVKIGIRAGTWRGRTQEGDPTAP